MGTKEGEGIAGKYILIEAPNFNNAASEAESMSTFLRLGAVKDQSIAANPNAPKGQGEDLAALITDFIDDTRVREGCPDYLTPEVRQAETALLHSKGGWRDHSDGNRITTTRGDKIEVIKGNYRMLILGRQNDAAGWDVSGGHVGQTSITYEGGASIEYSTEDYGGTWVTVEHTVKGHVHTAYHGKTYDYYCGEIVESITGSETPSDVQPNPVVTEKTWAESISSYTGSAALPVPLIANDTWVVAQTDSVNATTMTSTTTVVDQLSMTTAGTITDVTNVGVMASTTTAGTITDLTTSGLVASTTIGNVVDTTIGTSTSLIIGPETETIIGAMTELTVGAENSVIVGTETSMNLSSSLSLKLGAELSLALSASLNAVLGVAIDVFAGLKVEMTAACSVEITPSKFKINGQNVFA